METYHHLHSVLVHFLIYGYTGFHRCQFWLCLLSRYVHPQLLFLIYYVSCIKAHFTVSDCFIKLSHLIPFTTVTYSAPRHCPSLTDFETCYKVFPSTPIPASDLENLTVYLIDDPSHSTAHPFLGLFNSEDIPCSFVSVHSLDLLYLLNLVFEHSNFWPQPAVLPIFS